MFEKLLVPLDGSALSEIVIPYALEIAGASSGEIILVTASELSKDLTGVCESYQERSIASMREQSRERGANIVVRGHVAGGKPEDEILRLADEERSGLIIMAARGRTGQGSWQLGSVASKVLQAARQPVMVIKRPGVGQGEGARVINKILLPLDTSEQGAAAVPPAAELGRLLGASLVLFHVEPIPAPWLVAPGVEFAYVPPLSPERQASLLSSHTTYLDNVAGSLAAQGLEVFRGASAGFPASEIIRHARENSVDLIALSTHGTSGLQRFIYGSVTEKILQGTDVPVLVVRPESRR